MGTVRKYDEGTSCSLSGVQRVGFPEDIPSAVLPALFTEDLLGASSTELSLFSPCFSLQPNPPPNTELLKSKDLALLQFPLSKPGPELSTHSANVS